MTARLLNGLVVITTSYPVPGVLLITIDRPDRRNALHLEGFRQLTRAWLELEHGDARVGIVTGAGGDFSSGADLANIGAEMAKAAKTGDGDAVWQNIRHAVLRDVIVPKPVVSAIEGICFGGGMELVGGTDIRIAGLSARFAFPEVRHGVVASGGTLARLSRQIPYAAAMEILLTGAEQTASRMNELGYVNHVVDDGDALDRAVELARVIADNSPAAVAATKAALSRGARVSLAEAYEIEREIEGPILVGADALEGAKAFMEKRPPAWRLT